MFTGPTKDHELVSAPRHSGAMGALEHATVAKGSSGWAAAAELGADGLRARTISRPVRLGWAACVQGATGRAGVLVLGRQVLVCDVFVG